MAFPTPGTAGTIHTEDQQDFVSRDGRWAKTPFSRDFVLQNSSGSSGRSISARTYSPAATFIRVSATVQMTTRDDLMLKLGNAAGAHIPLSTTKVAQRWAQLSWSNSGMVVKDWNGQIPFTEGIAINGTREYAGVIENEPLDFEVKFMKVNDQLTALRMRTLYHASGNSAQLVNGMFYLMHPISDIRKFELGTRRNTVTFTIGAIALEWW